MKHLFSPVLVLSLLLLTACAEKEAPAGSGYGTMAVSLSTDSRIIDKNAAGPAVRSQALETRPGEAPVTRPDIDQFRLEVLDARGLPYADWEHLSQYDPAFRYSTGTYTLRASWGDVTEEGFDCPAYIGEAAFVIEHKKETPVDVTCTLANTFVTVGYTDAFRRYFDDYSLTLQRVGGQPVEFSKEESRTACFMPGNIRIILTMTTQTGQTVTFQPAQISNTAAREHYHLTFDVNNGEAGGARLVIVFDNQTEEEPVEIDLSDEFWNARAPEAYGEGFQPGQPLQSVELCESGLSAVRSVVNARSGIASCLLTTRSEYLLSLGWPATIDLADPEADLSKLERLGFRLGWLQNDSHRRTMVSADFTQLIPQLMISESGDDTHTFTLEVTDRLGKLSQPLVCVVQNLPLEITLDTPDNVYIGGGEARFPLHTNGDPAQVTIRYYYDNDWHDCTRNDLVPGSTPAVLSEVAIGNRPVQVKALYRGKIESPEVTLGVKAPAYSVVYDPADVWAHRAAVSVQAADPQYQAVVERYATYEYTPSGLGSWTPVTAPADERGRYPFDGLSGGTPYQVRASVLNDGSEHCAPTVLTTEAEQQVEDPSLESWTTGITKSSMINGANIFTSRVTLTSDVLTSYWADVNQKTFGGSPTVSSTYNTVMSTLKNESGHNGGRCAQLRTVGWDNSAGNSSLTLYHVAAGRLFMGSYSFTHKNGPEVYDYGQPFTSRPAAIKFWCRYEPYNGDNFKAWAVVEHRAGDGTVTRLAEGTLTGGEQPVWTEQTITLDYIDTTKKATHMYVVFVSSADCSDNEATETSNLKDAKLTKEGSIGGYTHYEGSNMYVDDISVVY
ncbi:MAG: DUF4493 domain-containing protein [Coprobacter sp.]|nr:DUF4493 domain-containing protein [Coprobacter sp.]